jgi:hypothetical protein
MRRGWVASALNWNGRQSSNTQANGKRFTTREVERLKLLTQKIYIFCKVSVAKSLYHQLLVVELGVHSKIYLELYLIANCEVECDG